MPKYMISPVGSQDTASVFHTRDALVACILCKLCSDVIDELGWLRKPLEILVKPIPATRAAGRGTPAHLHAVCMFEKWA